MFHSVRGWRQSTLAPTVSQQQTSAVTLDDASSSVSEEEEEKKEEDAVKTAQPTVEAKVQTQERTTRFSSIIPLVTPASASELM